ncbi:MAG: hypothetical protein Q9P01_14145 [Anaerolineae bacterium]|nr:hypothetical protein [Anaerolineae bacterium]
MRILNCTDCSPDTSCYRCIRDYNNQIYHSQLKREQALKYLELVYSASQTNNYSVQSAGIIFTSNPDYWLLQQVQNAKQSVSIWVDSLTVEPISGSQYDWLDILQDCLRRGVKINLNLQSSLEEDWVLVHYLRHLLNRYPNVTLEKIEQIPTWNILIDDGDDYSARAIRINVEQKTICLGESLIQNVVSTTHPEGLRQVKMQLAQIKNQLFILPSENSDNQVISINQGQITSERELFGDYFQKPISSLWINDPYLTNRYRIVERLGAYLDMADGTGRLQSITVACAR